MVTFLLVILFFAIGMVLLLYGYRLYMQLLPVMGFIAGFWLGADLTALILGTGFLGTIIGWVVGFLLGVVAAALSHLYHRIAFGVVGALLGYAIGSGLLTALGLGPGIFSFLAGLGVAVIVVALFYLLHVKKFLITAATSVQGANAILLALLLLIGRVSTGSLQAGSSPVGTVRTVLSKSWIWLLVWLALAIFGYVVQNRTNRALVHGEI